MLPSQLLRVRISRGVIYPRWARGSDEEIQLAQDLIEVFRIGAKLSEIHERVEEIEDMYEFTGIDYKFVRGLAILLERASKFERPSTIIEPERAREVMFRLVNVKYGGFVPEELREDVLSEAAKELGIGKEELERSLWADSDKLQVLVERPNYSPEELLREYNLSLLQTTLFKALNMKIETKAAGWEVKNVLRSLKRFGLMYTAEKGENGIIIEVSGPASILKMTTRYGVSLAKLIPYVISMSHWKIRAEISRNRRILNLLIDSRFRSLFPLKEMGEPEYDSSLERRFASIAEAGGWRTIREPEPLIVGKSIMIPDFLLVKGAARIYVEVMGFWTPEYIEKKVRKLSLLKEPMLVLVRKDLLCSRTENIPEDVFYIEGNKIDKVALFKRLNELEKKLISSIVRISDDELRGMVVDLRELARARGLTLDQLKRTISLEEYVISGDYAVKQDLINLFKGKNIPRKVKDFKSMLKDMNLPEEAAIPLALALGYEIIWHGLDEDGAELSQAI